MQDSQATKDKGSGDSEGRGRNEVKEFCFGGSSVLLYAIYGREDSPTYERTNQEKAKEDKSVVRWRRLGEAV